MTSKSESERSRAAAQNVMERLKTYDLAATPENYRFWYVYASGLNAPLTIAVNELIENEGAIHQQQIDELYLSFVSELRTGERLDRLGIKAVDDIEHIISKIDAALGSARTYSQALETATLTIAKEGSKDQLRSTVEVLLSAGREAGSLNKGLQQHLADSRQEIRALREDLEVVRVESLTDPLTSLANRKYFNDAFQRLVLEAKQKEYPLSLIISDIDHFKQFNDLFGHMIGDHVLRRVAASLKQNIKGRDIAARFGGEEFVVLLPHAPLSAAVTVAEQFRTELHAKELKRRSNGESLGRLTVSQGVATMRPGDTMTSLLERADTCLYRAKKAGRNCVVTETQIAPESRPLSAA